MKPHPFPFTARGWGSVLQLSGFHAAIYKNTCTSPAVAEFRDCGARGIHSPIKTFAPHQHPTPREGWGACSREQVQPQGWRSILPPVSPFQSQLRAKMPHLRGGARPSPAPGPAPPPRSQRSGPHLPRRERATAPALRTALGSGVRSGGSLGFARAPPLPLFSSDAAVEAVAAAAAAAAAVPRPEAHPPACGSRLPLPLPRHQCAPPPRRAGCLERGGGRKGRRRKGKGGGGGERLLGDLRHRRAPLSSRPSLE